MRAIPAYRFIETESARMPAGSGTGDHYDPHITRRAFGTKIKEKGGLRMAFHELLRQ